MPRIHVLFAWFVLAILGVGAHPRPCEATRVLVPDDHGTIQGAIDSGADSVFVRAGSYPERPAVNRVLFLSGVMDGGSGALPQVDGLVLGDAFGPNSAGNFEISVVRLHLRRPLVAAFRGTLHGSLPVIVADCVLDSTLDDTAALRRAQIEWGVSRCTLAQGIRLSGLPYGARITDNVVHGAIVVDADRVLSIADNVVDGLGTVGINAVLRDGDAGVVRNHVTGFVTGIALDVPSGLGTIAENSVDSCSIGIDVRSQQDSRLTGNVVRRCATPIYAIHASHLEVSRNIVEDCESGILAIGDQTMLDRNRLLRCGSGILAAGYRATLRNNYVAHCAGAGIVASVEKVTSMRDTVVDCDGGLVLREMEVHVVGARVFRCRGGGIETRAEIVTVDSSVVGRCGGHGIELLSEVTFALRNNTSYLNAGSGFAISDQYRTTGEVERNIAFRNGGLGFRGGFEESTIASACNDWFENLAGASSVIDDARNVSVDPQFCAVADDDVHLRSDSPLAGTACGLAGALGVDCDLTTPVQLARFTASRTVDGIRVEWGLEGVTMDRVFLERAPFRQGPWSRVASDLSPTGTWLDRGASSDAAWYRLVEATAAGDVALGQPINVEGATSELESLEILSANPVVRLLRVRFRLTTMSRIDLSAIDLQGRTVATLASGAWSAGQHEIAWDTSSFQPGIYWVRYRSNRGALVRRVIVSK